MSDPGPTRRVDQLLAHYAISHQHPVNEAIHMVAIPLIMISLVGLLYALHPLVALLFMGASLVYYGRLSKVFLLSMGTLSAVMLVLVQAMEGQRLVICLLLFVGGWSAQFIGHRYEGRKPSFVEDIQYLWVGPLFVLSRLFRRVGWSW